MSFATGNAQKDEWNWDEFSEIKGTIALQNGTVVITAGKEVTYLKVGKLLMSKSIGTALAVTWEATDQNNRFCFFKKVVDPNAKYDRYFTYYGNIAFCWRTEQHKITY